MAAPRRAKGKGTVTNLIKSKADEGMNVLVRYSVPEGNLKVISGPIALLKKSPST